MHMQTTSKRKKTLALKAEIIAAYKKQVFNSPLKALGIKSSHIEQKATPCFAILLNVKHNISSL